jgi:hypothetical protein
MRRAKVSLDGTLISTRQQYEHGMSVISFENPLMLSADSMLDIVAKE